MDTIEAVRTYGSIDAACRALGVARTTFRERYYKALQEAGLEDIRTSPQFMTVKKPLFESMVEAPVPPPDQPIEELLDLQSKRFRQLKGVDDVLGEWPIIKIKDPKPIGVLWFGDPHLGDNGCNIDLIRAHTNLCQSTDGLYGANIGDTTNNWLLAGKLAKKWADQESSIATEQRLAKWFMTESGVNWLVWLFGNHDAWMQGITYLRAINCNGIFMKNWEAKFILEFPNGSKIRVHAAHNFKGFSDWNPMHGPLKAAIKASNADLYIAGHIHTPGSMQINLQGSDRFPLLLRVGSYKRFDEYALTSGFPDNDVGAAVLTIFNPAAADRSGMITHFFDVEMGAKVLTVMREEYDEQAGRNEVRRGQGSAGASATRRADPDKLGPAGGKGKVRG